MQCLRAQAYSLCVLPLIHIVCVCFLVNADGKLQHSILALQFEFCLYYLFWNVCPHVACGCLKLNHNEKEMEYAYVNVHRAEPGDALANSKSKPSFDMFHEVVYLFMRGSRASHMLLCPESHPNPKTGRPSSLTFLGWFKNVSGKLKRICLFVGKASWRPLQNGPLGYLGFLLAHYPNAGIMAAGWGPLWSLVPADRPAQPIPGGMGPVG